jgi:hypothetical protein
MSDAISKAAAALGKRGGKAGTGKAKARSKEHYSAAGKKSGEARRAKAERMAALGVGKVELPQHIKDAQRKCRAAENYRMRKYGLTREQAKQLIGEDYEMQQERDGLKQLGSDGFYID